MSADCPGCWPTPKLPITRVKHASQQPVSREVADDSEPLPIDEALADHAD